MIEVRLNNGDWAEAETPGAALLAARTLWDEAVAAGTIQRPYVTFFVDEVLIGGTMNRAAIGSDAW